jgi:hypothetical protein
LYILTFTFLIYLILLPTIGSGIYSASNRNVYLIQKHVSGEQSNYQLVRLTMSPTTLKSVSSLIPPNPIGLHGLLRGQFYYFICRWCSYLRRNTLTGLRGLLWEWIYFFIHRWCSYLRRNTLRISYHSLFRGKIQYKSPWPVMDIALLLYM